MRCNKHRHGVSFRNELLCYTIKPNQIIILVQLLAHLESILSLNDPHGGLTRLVIANFSTKVGAYFYLLIRSTKLVIKEIIEFNYFTLLLIITFLRMQAFRKHNILLGFGRKRRPLNCNENGLNLCICSLNLVLKQQNKLRPF